MDLYTTYAKDFSNSRKFAWNGWKNLLHSELKFETILDLGCGNARFLEFLLRNQVEFRTYVGVDNSKVLLNIAKSKFNGFENVKFMYLDLEIPKLAKALDLKFSLITLFGVLHHIHTFEQRLELFKSMSRLLKYESASIVLTIWNFKEMTNWESKVIEKINDTDYVLKFGNSKAKRFLHYTKDEELQELADLANLEITGRFLSDGKTSKLNKYVILQRNKDN